MLPMNIDPKIQAMGIYIGYPLHGDKSRTSRTKRDFPCITQKIAIPSLILCGHMILYQKCSWLKFPMSFLMMPRSPQNPETPTGRPVALAAPAPPVVSEHEADPAGVPWSSFSKRLPQRFSGHICPPTKTSHIYIYIYFLQIVYIP